MYEPCKNSLRLNGHYCYYYYKHVKQTIIIYKHNTQKNHHNYHVYIITHLHGSVSYNHEKVNFRLFNAYKRYKVTKVKDGNSAIN